MDYVFLLFLVHTPYHLILGHFDRWGLLCRGVDNQHADVPLFERCATAVSFGCIVVLPPVFVFFGGGLGSSLFFASAVYFPLPEARGTSSAGRVKWERGRFGCSSSDDMDS